MSLTPTPSAAGPVAPSPLTQVDSNPRMTQQLEDIRIVVNRGARVRRVERKGQEYLVAPMTLMSPGVLSGSQGPLYYPPDEIARNSDEWNDTPIVVFHPKKGDRHVSGRTPDILDEYKIGRVYNAHIHDNKLKAEGWFHVESTRAADKKLGTNVLNALESNTPQELSTGVFVSAHPVENAGRDPFTNREYVAVARNYKRDHLAVLPGLRGACSITDGCGVLVNQRTPGEAPLETETDASVFELAGNVLEDQAGNDPNYWQDFGLAFNAARKGKGGFPSSQLKMTPSKACLILKDGKVHGKPLTEKQKGMFGALCGQRAKATRNWDPTDLEEETFALNDRSYSEKQLDLGRQLMERYGYAGGASPSYGPIGPNSPYLIDVYEADEGNDYIVYAMGSKMYRLDYEETDDGCVLSQDPPEEVERTTQYEPAHNAFCRTGEGGGIDPTCPSKGGGGDSTAAKRFWEGGGSARVHEISTNLFSQKDANKSWESLSERQQRRVKEWVRQQTGWVERADPFTDNRYEPVARNASSDQTVGEAVPGRDLSTGILSDADCGDDGSVHALLCRLLDPSAVNRPDNMGQPNGGLGFTGNAFNKGQARDKAGRFAAAGAAASAGKSAAEKSGHVDAKQATASAESASKHAHTADTAGAHVQASQSHATAAAVHMGANDSLRATGRKDEAGEHLKAWGAHSKAADAHEARASHLMGNPSDAGKERADTGSPKLSKEQAIAKAGEAFGRKFTDLSVTKVSPLKNEDGEEVGHKIHLRGKIPLKPANSSVTKHSKSISVYHTGHVVANEVDEQVDNAAAQPRDNAGRFEESYHHVLRKAVEAGFVGTTVPDARYTGGKNADPALQPGWLNDGDRTTKGDDQAAKDHSPLAMASPPASVQPATDAGAAGAPAANFLSGVLAALSPSSA